MPNNFQQQVIVEYARKRDARALSLNLMQPTRSGLREECLHVYAEKGYPKDDAVLRLFFGPVETGDDYVKRIRNFDVDKFRPLVNFLKDQTLNTQDKNIELLAWLIDFSAGPSIAVPGVVPKVDISNTPVPKDPKMEEDLFVTKLGTRETVAGIIPDQTLIPNHKLFDKRIIIALMTVIVVVLIGSFSTESSQCMYWAGNQYKSIPCDKKVGTAMIIALDTFKVANLKRITLPDTITERALGRVWYRKIRKDSIEFYTGAGEHPLDNKKRLMPLTDYILNKYVLQK